MHLHRDAACRVSLSHAKHLFLTPALRLLRHGETGSVNLFEYRISASAEQRFAYFIAQPHGIVTFAGFPQNFRSVRMCNQRIQANAAVLNFGESTDWNLATASQSVEQGALASGSGARGGVIQKGDLAARGRIAVANLNSQRSLAGCRSHHIDGDHLPDE